MANTYNMTYRDTSLRQPLGQFEGVDIDYATYMQRKKLYDPNYWKSQEESQEMQNSVMSDAYKKFKRQQTAKQNPGLAQSIIAGSEEDWDKKMTEAIKRRESYNSRNADKLAAAARNPYAGWTAESWKQLKAK